MELWKNPKIFFVKTVENPPESGVWVEETTERHYYGNVLKMRKRWDGASKVNDDLSIGNQLSIIADPYMYENLAAIRYCYFMGAWWKITDVEVERPRLTLTLGGVYNGKQVEPSFTTCRHSGKS